MAHRSGSVCDLARLRQSQKTSIISWEMNYGAKQGSASTFKGTTLLKYLRTGAPQSLALYLRSVFGKSKARIKPLI
jgi:hypothetical protein